MTLDALLSLPATQLRALLRARVVVTMQVPPAYWPDLRDWDGEPITQVTVFSGKLRELRIVRLPDE